MTTWLNLHVGILSPGLRPPRWRTCPSRGLLVAKFALHRTLAVRWGRLQRSFARTPTERPNSWSDLGKLLSLSWLSNGPYVDVRSKRRQADSQPEGLAKGRRHLTSDWQSDAARLMSERRECSACVARVSTCQPWLDGTRYKARGRLTYNRNYFDYSREFFY